MMIRDMSLGLGLFGALLLHGVLALLSGTVEVGEFAGEIPSPGERVYRVPPLRLPEAAPELPNKQDRPWFGEATGTGYGLHAAPGELIQHAPEELRDQAYISRDPIGPGRPPLEPSQSTVLSGDSGTGGIAVPARTIAEKTAPTQVPFGVATPSGASLMAGGLPLVTLRRTLDVSAGKELPAAQPVAAVIPPSPQSAAGGAPSSAPTSGKTGSGQPGASTPPADPAPETDSESDAFSRIGSVDLRPGRVNVRFGRKIRTVRPHFTIRGALDAFSMVDPTVVLKVNFDETGKVTNVSNPPIKSSGSNEIDLPWIVAVYKWQFEPPTDEDGKPLADFVILSLTVRE